MLVNDTSLGLFIGVQKCLTNFHNLVRFKQREQVYMDLVTIRHYEKITAYDETLKRLGLVYDVDTVDLLSFGIVNNYDKNLLRLAGLILPNGRYYLQDRYTLPIRNIDGNVTALVGYSNTVDQSKKYLTTPSLSFARSASFFGSETYRLAWEQFEGRTFVVEGIFDCVTLQHFGFPCLAVQGSQLTGYKSEILRRYSRLCLITDADVIGRKVNPLCTSDKRDIWKIPSDIPFSTLVLPNSIKDIDLLAVVMGDEFKEQLTNVLMSNKLYMTVS